MHGLDVYCHDDVISDRRSHRTLPLTQAEDRHATCWSQRPASISSYRRPLIGHIWWRGKTSAGFNGDTMKLEETRTRLVTQLRTQLRVLNASTTAAPPAAERWDEKRSEKGLALSELLRAALAVAHAPHSGGFAGAVDVLCTLGRLITAEAKHAGRYRNAASCFAAAAALAPQQLSVAFALGNARYQCGELAEATAAFQAGLAWGVDEWTRPAPGKTPLRACMQVNLGVALEAQSLFQQAADSYAIARRVHPGYAKAAKMHGGVLLALGRFEEAEKALAAAVEHHVTFAEAWADLGTVRRFTGDFRGAADALAHAARLKSDLVVAHWNLAQVRRDCGDHAEAVVSCDAVLALQPGMLPALVLRALCERELGGSSARDSLERLRSGAASVGVGSAAVGEALEAAAAAAEEAPAPMAHRATTQTQTQTHTQPLEVSSAHEHDTRALQDASRGRLLLGVWAAGCVDPRGWVPDANAAAPMLDLPPVGSGVAAATRRLAEAWRKAQPRTLMGRGLRKMSKLPGKTLKQMVGDAPVEAAPERERAAPMGSAMYASSSAEGSSAASAAAATEAAANGTPMSADHYRGRESAVAMTTPPVASGGGADSRRAGRGGGEGEDEADGSSNTPHGDAAGAELHDMIQVSILPVSTCREWVCGGSGPACRD